MEEQNERFGALLRRYREAAGFSQEELAERAGLSKNAIGGLERGERLRPYPDTLRRLADALELSAADHGRLIAATRVKDDPPADPPEATAGPATAKLPHYMEALIGRERECEEALRFLKQPDIRLLTFTGAGGVGKTRLTIEVARRALTLFPDGVAFTPLAPV